MELIGKKMDLTEKVEEENYVYKGEKVNLSVDKMLVPNRQIVQRELIHRVDNAVILPILEDNSIILEGQFRHSFSKEIISLPAGKKDEDEKIEKTALRELEEETGYIAKKLVYLGKTIPAPAYSNEVVHIFLATNLEKGKIKRDEFEFLNIYKVSQEEFKKMIEKNEILDSRTIIAYYFYLDYLKRN